MLTPAEFAEATQWAGIITLVSAVLVGIGFGFKWGIRFRLVGITGFMAVLTGGLFALSIAPLLMHPVVPGAVKFSTVYDSGADQIAIKVPLDVTETELEATLRQAATDLLAPGRRGYTGRPPLIRARVILHPEPGLSQLVYLGEASRVATTSPDEDPLAISIFSDTLAQLNQTFDTES